MKYLTLILSILILGSLGIPVAGQKVVKESVRSQEKDRSYYLFVPENIDKAKPAPLIIMLHGTGRNGLTLIDKWKDFAKSEGIIIVGPDASTAQGWKIPEDAPEFIYDLTESIKAKYPVNPRRVYLFGHSAGAVAALYLSLLESEYFAATAIHAGALRPDDGPYIERSKRKTPIAMFVGTNDAFFPLAAVRSTRDMLNARGFNTELAEISGHTHDYYGRSSEINKKVWEFLKKHELTYDPKYEHYRWK